MLPNSPTVRKISIIFGGLTSSILSCLAFMVFALWLSNGGFFAAFIAFSGLCGGVAMWSAITDTRIAERSWRLATIAGLAAGIFSVVQMSIWMGLWEDIFFTVFDLILLFLFASSALVGTYHLIRLIQYEVRSRPPQP